MTITETSRLFRRMVAINIAGSIAYRTDFVFFMLGSVFGPLLSALIWRAAIASGAELPMDTSALMTYFVLMAVVSMLTSSWLSPFLAGDIRNGRLSIWLARPGTFLYEMAANNLAEKAIKGVVLLPMVLVFAWMFRNDIDLGGSAWRWLLMLPCIALGATIAFAMDVAEGSLAFWMDDVSGLTRARGLLALVLSGQLIPLALMPEWAQGFLAVQPFRYIISFPLELVTGDLNGRDVLLGLAAQACYALLFVFLARRVWTRGQRAYTAVGN